MHRGLIERALISVGPPAALLVLAAMITGALGCTQGSEVIVYHAASLRRVMADAAQQFQRENPGVIVRLDPGGSQLLARKISEMNMRPDVLAVADAQIITRLLVPRHAEWSLVFATNEIVLAHMDHSLLTAKITAQNWPTILLRKDVRLGCVNPDLAPLGYHTVFVWQLAARTPVGAGAGPELPTRLAARCAGEHAATDETELLGLLEAKAVDYAFMYRSTAQDHRLKLVTLPPEINLSRAELDKEYQAAATEVRLAGKGAKTTLNGHVITYGLTIPAGAPNQAGAERFVAFLLGPHGQRILQRAGLVPMTPARVDAGATSVPASVQSLVSSGGR